MKAIILFFLFTGLLSGQQIKVQHQINRSNHNFFIENKGQWPQEVNFLAKVGGMNAWITNSGVTFDYFRTEINHEQQEVLTITPGREDDFQRDVIVTGHVISMQYVDATRSVSGNGDNKQEGYYNYFIGSDQSKWASFVSLYGSVEYSEIYDDINIRYYFEGNSIRYDYIVKAGADLSQIRLKFSGQDGIRINESGELIIQTRLGEVTNGKLYSFQYFDGKKQEVQCGFVHNNDGTVGFSAPGYDKSKELIIDPLIYSTFVGGSLTDMGSSLILDKSGNIYIGGYTSSVNYPTTTGAYQITKRAGEDLFVTKLNHSANGLIYSTFIGGSSSESGFAIALDSSDNVYIAGSTNSSDYPTTPGAYQTSFGGGIMMHAVVVTKLNTSGSSLIYSTFIGWSDEIAFAIAVDENSNAYITGLGSLVYPTTSGAYNTSTGGVFVTKLNYLGSKLIYSTFIGWGAGYSIAIDTLGNAYITGRCTSNFPSTPGAYQTNNAGGTDAFATKLNSDGSDLIYSTFLGGVNDDIGYSITIDKSCNGYITGFASSSNFPTTSGTYQPIYKGGARDAFVSKLNNAGDSLIYSTFIGGTEAEYGNAIAIDSEGNAYITGSTTSNNFPTSLRSIQGTYAGGNQWGGDVFFTKLNSIGSYLMYSTYIGGSSYDDARSMALNQENDIYLFGFTGSVNYPTTMGSYQPHYGDGYYDAFITKLNTLPSPVGLFDEYETIIPQRYALEQNYPNPFNPSTIIRYHLPLESIVAINIFNSIGEMVHEFKIGNKSPGFYELEFNSLGLASGIYFYSIKAVSIFDKMNFFATRKMIILR